jgi:hypothetical protein
VTKNRKSKQARLSVESADVLIIFRLLERWCSGPVANCIVPCLARVTDCRRRDVHAGSGGAFVFQHARGAQNGILALGYAQLSDRWLAVYESGGTARPLGARSQRRRLFARPVLAGPHGAYSQ